MALMSGFGNTTMLSDCSRVSLMQGCGQTTIKTGCRLIMMSDSGHNTWCQTVAIWLDMRLWP